MSSTLLLLMIPSFQLFAVLLIALPTVSQSLISQQPQAHVGTCTGGTGGMCSSTVNMIHHRGATIIRTEVRLMSSRMNDEDGNNSSDRLSKSNATLLPEISLCRKPKQIRRAMKKPRRPSAFWADINNIEHELRLFWSSVNVPIDTDKPPPIPNEALLNHFERHDLRYAIANMGGREFVAKRLGGARLVPGKWFEACKTSEEVKCLLKPSNPAGVGLTKAVPPIAPHVKRSLVKVAKRKRGLQRENGADKIIDEHGHEHADADADARGETHGNLNDENSDDAQVQEQDELIFDEDALSTLRFQAGERWAHQSSRNPRGYWDQDVVIKEL